MNSPRTSLNVKVQAGSKQDEDFSSVDVSTKYFRTQWSLWTISLKEHRFAKKFPRLAKVLDLSFYLPAWVRRGLSWGTCWGMFTPIGWQARKQEKLLAALPTIFAKEPLYKAFSSPLPCPHAVKLRVLKNWRIQLWVLANEQTNASVYAYREIFPSERKAVHHVLTFLPRYRGLGWAGKILKATVDYYLRAGITKIELMAGLSAGGAVWAKVGFLPSSTDKEGVYETVRKNLARLPPAVLKDYQGKFGYSLAKTVDEIIAKDERTSFWKLSDLGPGLDLTKHGYQASSLGRALLAGARWKAHLDLQDECVMQRFHDYVARPVKK